MAVTVGLATAALVIIAVEGLSPCAGPRSPQQFLSRLARPPAAAAYDRTLRPPCARDLEGESCAEPTLVEVQMHLTQLNSIDQKHGHIEVSGYFRTWWRDPRLSFNSTAEGGCFDTVQLHGEEAAGLWRPDLYFDNLVQEKTADTFAALTEISPDGSVARAEQVLLKLSCPMDLGKLPFDSHDGKIVVASFSQDIQQMRVMARGGVKEQSQSGIGLEGPAITSAIWEFPEGTDAEHHFSTPGLVRTLRSSQEDTKYYDFVTLHFHYVRKSKYYFDTVSLPVLLFLLVSYLQFFVDPAAAPARATIAVTAVLIMRTMSDSVFSALPHGSQRMWLTDKLTASMIVCVLAAIEFGVVQLCLLREKRHAQHLAGLLKVKKTAEHLLRQSKKEGITLLTLLKRYAAQEVAVDIDEVRQKLSQEHFEAQERDVEDANPAHVTNDFMSLRSFEMQKMLTQKTASAEARAARVKESDLMFVQYARATFEKFDVDGSNNVCPREARQALNSFNIYMSTEQTAQVICMFLRDSGDTTPLDDMEARLTFSKFTRLLLEMDTYTQLARRPSWRKSLSCRHVRGYLQALPPSARCDIVARILFPVVILIQYLTFEALRSRY